MIPSFRAPAAALLAILNAHPGPAQEPADAHGSPDFPVEARILVDGAFQRCEGIAFNGEGRLFVAGNSALWEVAGDGSVSWVADLFSNLGLAPIGDRDILMADFGPTSRFDTGPNADGIVWRITPEGEKTRVLDGGIGDPNALWVLGNGLFLVSDDATDEILVANLDGQSRLFTDAVGHPNGIAVSPDGSTLYAAQIFRSIRPLVPDGRLWALPLDDTGEIAGPPEVLADLGPQAANDGLALDEFGRIYVAANGAGQIWRVDPETGETVLVAENLPGAASLAFGRGEFDPHALYATSTRTGRVWEVDVGVKGAPLHRDLGVDRPPSLSDRVDAHVRSLGEAFSGTVLVAVGNEVLLEKGYGLANRSYGIPNDPDTRFHLGSITKQFTAVLALRLAEAGVLDLSATVQDYIPDYRGPGGNEITLHQLLSHTSGIPHHFLGIPGYFRGYDQLFHTPAEYLAAVESMPLAHPPGGGFTYSSPGYTLLAMIMERASGRSYAELLRDHILDPLGMEETTVGNGLTILPKLASGYMAGLEGWVMAEHEEESNRKGAGAIIATARDLYRFQRVLDFRGDTILSAEGKRRLLLEQTEGFSYLGSVNRLPYNEGGDTLTFVSGGGSSYGFQARVDRLVEMDAVVVALSNTQGDGSVLEGILHQAEEALLEELGVPLRLGGGTAGAGPDTMPAPDSLLDACQGFYRFEDGSTRGVFREGSGLVTTRSVEEFAGIGSGIQRSTLSHEGKTSFSVDQDPGTTFRFIVLDGPAAQELQVISGDRLEGTARRWSPPASAEMKEYEGIYDSVELQRSIRLTAIPGGLSTPSLVHGEEAVLTYLGPDRFGYRGGYLTFHRTPEGRVQDFRLDTAGTDSAFGSRFVRLF